MRITYTIVANIQHRDKDNPQFDVVRNYDLSEHDDYPIVSQIMQALQNIDLGGLEYQVNYAKVEKRYKY